MDSKRYTEEELKNLQDLKSKCENAMTAIRELGICLATKDGSGLPHAQERHRNRFGNRTFSKEDFQRDILSEDLGIYVYDIFTFWKIQFFTFACFLTSIVFRKFEFVFHVV